ncbi:flagellar biosynthesis protein FlgD [Candidatus Endobugula sertula]|uniref:Basal-body rod modification protein FlgD n=1 Tax=Candidatus Endobugula sertula TaxID=62101 RepID=A0A1D2QQI3_9GAMM|nr:flagellar biosynthesis protein FlgD [Candidatus Endobugula sertula]
MNNDIANNTFLNTVSLDRRQEVAAEQEKKSGNELGQSVFLELMITQLENQDPLSPQENSDFIAQLAQFSSVEGLERLNTNFDDFSGNFRSNQALEASSLVGRPVSVPTSEAQLVENGFVGGTITLPQSTTELTINIYNEDNALVQQVPLGTQRVGDVVFRWDGKRIEVNGELTSWQATESMISGNFRFEALALQQNELGAMESEQLETALTANVNSVTAAENGQLILNLSGLGAVNINDVKQFN